MPNTAVMEPILQALPQADKYLSFHSPINSALDNTMQVSVERKENKLLNLVVSELLLFLPSAQADNIESEPQHWKSSAPDAMHTIKLPS